MKNLMDYCEKKVYFVGIGGISMSGLARLLKNSGAVVSGSDIGVNNSEIAKLEALGIVVNRTHDEKNIKADIDLVVYNYAIPNNNPEVIRAKELNIKCMSRAELLGLVACDYKNVIAISGTHGKTTTTALIGEIFAYAGLCPTIHIGGESINMGDNTIIGKDDFLIVEACEYHNSFKYLFPTLGAILNIDADHLDYYKDLDDVYSAFRNFATQNKTLICDESVKLFDSDTLIVGKDIEAKNVEYSEYGYNFDVYIGGELWDRARINILGRHNIKNALFAVLIALKFDIPKSVILSALSEFKGVKRRSEKLGELYGVPVIIDYAHHPTEIEASLSGFGEIFKAPLIVFQPHTFSRTKSLFGDFIRVLLGYDNLIIFKTYPARECEIVGGRAEDLCESIDKARYIDNANMLFEKMKELARTGKVDAIVVLGAGDLAEKLRCYF